jgi:hypothetical protein
LNFRTNHFTFSLILTGKSYLRQAASISDNHEAGGSEEGNFSAMISLKIDLELVAKSGELSKQPTNELRLSGLTGDGASVG